MTVTVTTVTTPYLGVEATANSLGAAIDELQEAIVKQLSNKPKAEALAELCKAAESLARAHLAMVEARRTYLTPLPLYPPLFGSGVSLQT